MLIEYYNDKLKRHTVIHKYKATPKMGSAGAPPLAVEAWMTARNTLLHHSYYPAELDRSGSNATIVIKQIRLKHLTPRVPPFKVTEVHRNRHGSIRHLCSFVCLGFNGTFSTNRLYRAVTVG